MKKYLVGQFLRCSQDFVLGRVSQCLGVKRFVCVDEYHSLVVHAVLTKFPGTGSAIINGGVQW